MSDELESENAISPASDSRKAQVVDVYDGSLLIGTAPVDANGSWHLDVNGLARGAHGFIAKLKGVQSSAWNISVREPLQLGPPVVEEVYMGSSGNSLNLVKQISSATVVVNYPNMQVGDLVTVFWDRPTGNDFSETKVAGSSSLAFIVPATYFSINGMRITVSYSVKPSGQTEAVESQKLEFVVNNPTLVGAPFQTVGARTMNYNCRYGQSTITVYDNDSDGKLLGKTSAAAPAPLPLYSIDSKNPYSDYFINQIGPQPTALIDVFPSNVPGIGLRFIYTRPGTSDVSRAAGPRILPAAQTGAARTTGIIEFVKTGPVVPGVIPSGPLLMDTCGTQRLEYISFNLAAPVSIIRG